MTIKKLSRIPIYALLTALISSMLSGIAGAASYTVRKGDTLWKLAKKFQTTPEAIARNNGFNVSANLSMGKVLNIPSLKSIGQSRRSEELNRRQRSAIVNDGGSVHVRLDSVCLRSEPNTSSDKVDVLEKGTTLTLMSREDAWAKVSLADGRTGYVHRSLLAPGEACAKVETRSNNNANSSLIEAALSCRGTVYRRGGTSRGGFDCSGFTRYIFAKYGVRLPHSSAAQSRIGQSVSRDQLRSGDLVFFSTTRAGISHVGIYIGEGRFVHAANRGRGVTVDALNSAYYASRFRVARRVM